VVLATFAWAFAAIAVVELHDMGLETWVSTAVLAVVSVGVATMVQTGIVGPLRRQAALQAGRRRRAEALLEASCRELELIDSTEQALEQASSEGEALDVLRRVVVTAAPEHDAHLLLCDSEGGFSHAVALHAEGFGPPDQVEILDSCPSMRAGVSAVSASADEPGACPYAGLPDCDVASACIPMRTASVEVGMVRLVGAAGDTPSGASVRRIERTARRCATRIAELRAARAAASGPADRAASSTLELANEVDRDTVERVARSLIARLERFALALVCVDRSSTSEPHVDPSWPAGATDLLGDVLDETLRPTDVIGRTEESFMLLLPEADAASALAALERVRENLVLRLAELGAHPFTASIGVAASTDAADLQSLTLSADLALRMAQRQGGNRVRSWDADAHRDHGAGTTRD